MFNWFCLTSCAALLGDSFLSIFLYAALPTETRASEILYIDVSRFASLFLRELYDILRFVIDRGLLQWLRSGRVGFFVFVLIFFLLFFSSFFSFLFFV